MHRSLHYNETRRIVLVLDDFAPRIRGRGDVMTTVGVVGLADLGAIGSRIASRLLAQGHVVHGTNRTAAKANRLIDQGLQLLATTIGYELLSTARAAGSEHRDIAAMSGMISELAAVAPGSARAGASA
jgi:prephenate dehydrogenase